MKTLKKELREKLERVLMDIKLRYPLLNAGGCGIFGLSLGKVLNKLGYEYEYYLIIRNKHTLEEANHYINRNDVNSLNSTDWTHLVVKVGKYYIDVDGVRKEVKKTYEVNLTDPLSEELLKEMLKEENRYMWNRTFDRKQMRSIDVRLKELLK